MANTPSRVPLLVPPVSGADIAILNEALETYETVRRYAATLAMKGPERDQLFKEAGAAARLLERLALNRPSERGVPV